MRALKQRAHDKLNIADAASHRGFPPGYGVNLLPSVVDGGRTGKRRSVGLKAGNRSECKESKENEKETNSACHLSIMESSSGQRR